MNPQEILHLWNIHKTFAVSHDNEKIYRFGDVETPHNLVFA